jgi:hypothetical protein
LFSSALLKKLGLTTHAHSKLYHLEWLNNSGKAKVTRSTRVYFLFGSYHDYANFDVVPMQACSFLLGCSWEYDIDALHHDRTNRYTLMHKSKKIVLLYLTPVLIVKHDNEHAEISKNDHALDSSGATTEEIKLKGGASIATTSLNAENYIDDAPCRAMLCRHISFSYAPCHTMLCRHVLFSHDHNPMSSNLRPVVTNLLQ